MKLVSEVMPLLQDRAFAEAVMTKVNKGSKGSFDYVPWNETVAILDRLFGPMGWSAKLTDRQVVVAGPVYVYNVGLELTVRARDDETGDIIEVSRPGVGVGIVTPNRNGEIFPDAHDTAAKGARSDALSTAAKMLGNAFGLFLYDKGDPARAGNAAPRVAAPAGEGLGSASAASGWDGAMKKATTRSGKDVEVPSYVGEQGHPSVAQYFKLKIDGGFTPEQIAGMAFPEWKGHVDRIMGGGQSNAGAGNGSSRFPFSEASNY